MGRVPEPHASPKAPEDRPWDWHGTAEADSLLRSIDRP